MPRSVPLLAPYRPFAVVRTFALDIQSHLEVNVPEHHWESFQREGETLSFPLEREAFFRVVGVLFMFKTPTDPKTDEHPRPPLFLGDAIPSFLPSEEGSGSGRGKRDVIEIRCSLPVMFLDYSLSYISICL